MVVTQLCLKSQVGQITFMRTVLTLLSNFVCALECLLPLLTHVLTALCVEQPIPPPPTVAHVCVSVCILLWQSVFICVGPHVFCAHTNLVKRTWIRLSRACSACDCCFSATESGLGFRKKKEGKKSLSCMLTVPFCLWNYTHTRKHAHTHDHLQLVGMKF